MCRHVQQKRNREVTPRTTMRLITLDTITPAEEAVLRDAAKATQIIAELLLRDISAIEADMLSLRPHDVNLSQKHAKLCCERDTSKELRRFLLELPTEGDRQ